GARERILPESLIFSVDLDARHCAGADVASKHNVIAVRQIVVEPQRVQAGPFEHGKISALRIQSQKRGWQAIAGEVSGGRGKVAGARKLLQGVGPGGEQSSRKQRKRLRIRAVQSNSR